MTDLAAIEARIEARRSERHRDSYAADYVDDCTQLVYMVRALREQIAGLEANPA